MSSEAKTNVDKNLNNNVSNMNMDGKTYITNIDVLGKKEIEIKTEYLFLLKVEEGFFETDKNIENIFFINNNIKIQDKNIDYKGTKIGYKLASESLKNNSSEKYVHLMFEILVLDKDDENFANYNEFLRIVKKIITKWDSKHEILWDGVGYYYAIQTYPLIYEIENLIRKLITKFMLKNLGRDWTKKYISQEIKRTVKSENRIEDRGNYLYNVDFKQLENFLFDEFSNEDSTQLYTMIKSGKCEMEDLKKYLPESNWNRLFSKLITNVKEKELRDALGEFYKLRCKVAHNNIILTKDFEDINKYYEFLQPHFKTAVDKIDEIEQPQAKEVAASIEKFLSVGVRSEISEEENAVMNLNDPIDNSTTFSIANMDIDGN